MAFTPCGSYLPARMALGIITPKTYSVGPCQARLFQKSKFAFKQEKLGEMKKPLRARYFAVWITGRRYPVLEETPGITIRDICSGVT